MWHATTFQKRRHLSPDFSLPVSYKERSHQHIREEQINHLLLKGHSPLIKTKNNTSIMRSTTRDAQMTGGDYFITTNGGTMLRRIRSPHVHDVLCGRGGGINSHVGNRIFRDWVAERRLDYNLASTKADKARVAKEVMNRVTIQTPPGRFLQRDPTGGIGSWWIEITEEKAMAKTSQALREGAPSIRAQHHPSDISSPKSRSITERTRSREEEAPSSPSISSSSFVPSPLMSNADFDQCQDFHRPAKKTRMDPDGTPTLTSACGSEIPTLYLEPSTVLNTAVTRSVTTDDVFKQSTCAWTMDAGRLDEFVNPFENEEESLELYCKALALDKPVVSVAENCLQSGSQHDALHQTMEIFSI